MPRDDVPPEPRKPRRPWIRPGQPIGLGDAIKNVTSSIGIGPCPGCERRAAALNRWLTIGGARAASAAPSSTAKSRSSSVQSVCEDVRIRVCAAFAILTQVICDVFVAVTKFVCTQLQTITTTICDVTQTIATTVCDLTSTVSHTICDATTSVCNTICDATSWLPWPLDDLICEASHVVCSAVCTVSHIVSETICAASHIVSSVICAVSHIVTTVTCLLGSWISDVVCFLSHVIRTIACILWSLVVALICIPLRIWQWLWCQFKRFLRIFIRRRKHASQIKHVFVLMLENRSFDHMLGFSGVPGGLTPNTHSNPDPNAGGAPRFAATPADFFLTSADTDPAHEFNYVLTQLCFDPNTGTTPAYSPGAGYPPLTNAGFVAAYEKTDSDHPHASANPGKTMDCFDPVQLPVLTALAREFAVCNRWFASMPGPTWPNRFFVHAASSGGLDDSPSGFDSITATLIDGYAFENATIFDALDEACIEWKIFHGDSLPQVFAISGMTVNRLLGKFRSFDEFAENVNDPDYSAAYTFIEPDYGNVLPVISAADFTCGNSQHPLDDVTRGELLIKNVYETIRNSPHWNSSVLIVTYDEHGGFYDHVPPPPAVPPGDAISDPANNHHDFAFDRLGVRVPAVIISPLIPRGVVDTTQYDHSSVPATLERLFGLSPLTDRDAAANDILHLFTLTSPRNDAPVALPDPAVSGFECKDDD